MASSSVGLGSWVYHLAVFTFQNVPLDVTFRIHKSCQAHPGAAIPYARTQAPWRLSANQKPSIC